MRVIAPWGKKSALPGDMERLHAVEAWIDPEAMPARVCWVFTDGRMPEPVRGTPPGWLAAWARDRAVYRVEARERC
jgi:hypothetical protein